MKSPRQSAKDIAARAYVDCESVRRSAACSGEHNYTYTHTGFRVFRDPADGNYAENLINDYQQVYEKGNSMLPYHAALTALHHTTASKSVATFLSQPSMTQQLIEMRKDPVAWQERTIRTPFDEPLYQLYDAISQYFAKRWTYARMNRSAQRFGIGIWGGDYEHS